MIDTLNNIQESIYSLTINSIKIVIGIAALSLLLADNAASRTLTVDANGSANYTRIQDAINDSGAGDTISVNSGTYYEKVDINKYEKK